MFRLYWLRLGGATRAMPRRNRIHPKHWPVIGLVACMALFQSGCQSGPFSNCGTGVGSGLFSPCGFFGRVSSRVFNRSNGSAGCCAPGVVSDGAVEYAAPSTVITPGATAGTSYGSGVGTSSSPSYPAPLPGEEPANLSPADPKPNSKVLSPSNGSGPSGSLPGNKTSYQTRRQDPNSRLARRPVRLPGTTASTPEPTSRSARALALPSARDSSGVDDQNPLDHLPPLDLPGEVTKSAATPPVPPAAERKEKSGTQTEKKAAVKDESPAPAADDLDLTSGSIPAVQTSPSASVGPGINRFVAVDLKLAGGSAPASDGLKWLIDKGYRTVLDLRESSEVPSSFITEVTNLGLRYIALPISLKTIDRAHVDRFHFEVAAGEARPLFFFDSDGTRAGALWYIHRIANDRIDHQIARREAEELGLTDKNYWAAATNYVAALGGPRTTATSADPGQSPSLSPVTVNDSQTDQNQTRADESQTATPVPKSRQQSSQSTANPAAAAPTQASTAPDTELKQPAPSRPDSVAAAAPDLTFAWRPLAAMVLSGLALPLAYWSRTLTPIVLSKARASLPGPAHRPKSLPAESGA
jgi:protein tyrosine phosphatase (PTP) superfamily phosphohydrolase (DUF442 family)